MKKIAILISVTIVLCSAQEKNNWYIKGGLNTNSYKNTYNIENVSSMTGYNFGAGYELLFKNYFFVSVGLEYIVKGANLHNKTIQPLDENILEIYNYDIQCRFAYLEIPIFLKHGFNLKNDFFLKLYSGITYSKPIKDMSKIIKKDLRGYRNPEIEYYYDFQKYPESVFEDNKGDIVLSLGLELKYKFLGINLQYSLDGREIYFCDSITPIYKTLYGFHIGLIFYH